MTRYDTYLYEQNIEHYIMNNAIGTKAKYRYYTYINKTMNMILRTLQ